MPTKHYSSTRKFELIIIPRHEIFSGFFQSFKNAGTILSSLAVPRGPQAWSAGWRGLWGV